MSDSYKTDNPELEALFERYRRSPGGFVFAPLADACRKAGMLEEAIEICEKGVSAHPGYASGYVVRGKCYYDLGNSDQAEASFEKVLELDAHNLVALKYMGLILAERGIEREARAHFEHILELDPDDREISARLAEMDDTGDDDARSLTSELNDVLGTDDDGAEPEEDAEPIELRPVKDEDFVGSEITLGDGEQTPDVLATMTLAEIYASQGYRKKALKIFDELEAMQPGNHRVREKRRELGLEGKAPAGSAAADDAPPAEAPSTPVPPGAASAPTPKPKAPERKPPPVVSQQEDTGGAGKAGAETDPRNAVHFKRWLENFNR